MRRTLALIAVVLTLGVIPAAAQTNPRRALAEELMNTMNMRSQLDQTMNAVKQLVVAQTDKMRQSMGQPEASAKEAEFRDKLFAMMGQMFSYDKIKEEFISIYAETFTEDEMKGAIQFYKSPAGKALLAKQPELAKRSMEMSMKLVTESLPKIMQMVKETAGSQATQPK